MGSHLVGDEASERRPCRDELFPGLRPLLTPPKRGVHFAKNILRSRVSIISEESLWNREAASCLTRSATPARSLVPAWTPLARHFSDEPRSRSRRNVEWLPSFGKRRTQTVRLFSFPTRRGNGTRCDDVCAPASVHA